MQGENSFIGLRFLLGVTEAGLFPGVIMFLAAWFPNNVRVKMLAIFYLGLPISQAIGSPLSGWLISLGDQLGWITGWQLARSMRVACRIHVKACPAASRGEHEALRTIGRRRDR